MWIRVLVLTLLTSLTVSCVKSFVTVAGSTINTDGIKIVRIDTTRIGPETFLKVYYRNLK